MDAEALAEVYGNLQGRDIGDDAEWAELVAAAEADIAAAARGEVQAWWEDETR